MQARKLLSEAASGALRKGMAGSNRLTTLGMVKTIEELSFTVYQPQESSHETWLSDPICGYSRVGVGSCKVSIPRHRFAPRLFLLWRKMWLMCEKTKTSSNSLPLSVSHNSRLNDQHRVARYFCRIHSV